MDHNLEPQIFIMTKVVGLVRMFPEEVFPNIETKQNMIAAASDYLDQLIMEESGESSGHSDAVENERFGILGDLASIDLGLDTSNKHDNLIPAHGKNNTTDDA